MELGQTILEMRSWNPENAPAPRLSRVLIVDDNPVDIALVRRSLREAPHRKFECQVAESLSDALWKLDELQPNVLLMAFELRGGSGVYAFQKLRQILPTTPIIVYSDLDEPDLGEALIREGAQDFISTHMIRVPGVLARIIQHAVQRERTREALRNASQELNQRRGQLEKTAMALQEARMSLVDAERMRTIGRLSAGVAHEVKNPLAVIRLSMDYLSAKLDKNDPVITKVVGNLYDAVNRANSIIMGMLDFGAPKPLSREAVEAKFMVLEAFNMTEHAMMKHHVDFSMDISDDLPMVLADYEKCVQVLVNLFLNACHAIKEQGSIFVRASVVQMRDTELQTSQRTVDALELVIEDSGPGIPEDALSKLFEPFFTTKDKEGTGMGLCVAQMIMHMHGGDLTAENRKRGGARFRMFWPLKDDV